MKIPKTASPSGLSAAFSGVPYWIDEEGSTLNTYIKEKCLKAIWAFCLFNKPWCCSEQCAARHRTASRSQCARFHGRRTSPNGRAFATPTRCHQSDAEEVFSGTKDFFVVFVAGNLEIDLPYLGFCCWLSAFSMALFGKFYLELARNGSSSETTALSRKLDEPWCARVGHGQRRTLISRPMMDLFPLWNIFGWKIDGRKIHLHYHAYTHISIFDVNSGKSFRNRGRGVDIWGDKGTCQSGKKWHTQT